VTESVRRPKWGGGGGAGSVPCKSAIGKYCGLGAVLSAGQESEGEV